MARAVPASSYATHPMAGQTKPSPLGRVCYADELIYDRPRKPFSGGMRVFGAFATVYIYEGGGHYEDTRGHRQAVAPGDLILVFPDLPHQYVPGERGWSELYIVFEGPVFDLWTQSGLISRDRPVLHLEPVEHWRRRFEWVLGESLRSGQAPPLVEVCRLQQVLAEAVAAGQARPPGDKDGWLAAAQAALSTDLARETDLEAVAAGLGMGYATFRRRFTELTGQSPGRYRTARVVERACELIAHGGLSDKEVAAELGFCDPFHFSKRFKRVTGRTPTQFRRSLPHLREG